MSKLLIVTIILSIPILVIAQPQDEWMHMYDHNRMDRFYDVYAVVEGGYITCGYSQSANIAHHSSGNFYVVRVDEDGSVIWESSYGQEDVSDQANTIIEADNGDFVAAGYTNDRRDLAIVRINPDGEQIWWQTYETGNAWGIIELKNGNFMIAGETAPRGEGLLMTVDGDGEIIWRESYLPDGDRAKFRALRETDNGVVAAGYLTNPFLNNGYRKFWIQKVNHENEGEVIWSTLHRIDYISYCYDMASTGDGGFVLVGWTGRIPQNQREEDYSLFACMLKVNDEGASVWTRRYRVWNQSCIQSAYGIVRMDNGDYVIAGHHQLGFDYSSARPFVLQTDSDGEELWRRGYLWDEEDPYGDYNGFYSIVKGPDECLIACGGIKRTENNVANNDGVLVKIEPTHPEPLVFYWLPEDTNFTTLRRDTTLFIVRARDQQGDEFSYRWLMGEDSLGVDSTTAVVWEDVGESLVQCRVSDGENISAINWHVKVVDMYIDSYLPEILTHSVRRNSTIDFNITTRATADDPIEYLWLLNDEQIADDDSVSIRFERGREHSVTAVASQGELSDSVMWQVMVNDLIVDYMPERFDLSVPIDTTFEFEVFPFNPNDDSLKFLWTVNGDSVWNRSWLLMNFDEEGMYSITAYVSDTTESDSLTWEVNVQPNSIHTDEPRHPETTTLHPPTPNPFNSRTRIRYSLAIEDQIELWLYDVSGRRVVTLYSGVRAAGVWSATLDGSELSSGVYFVGMSVGEHRLLQKVVLVK